MRLDDFRALVDRLAAEVPIEYLDGIVEIEVSPKTVSHPVRAGVYTMGECIPVDTGGDAVTSRVVLYHGSFQALAAERSGLDWRDEAWETLLHELRHHVEWRAQAGHLEAYDWAADQNFRRADGEPFDALFYLSGERVEEGVFRVEDDLFWDVRARQPPTDVEISWQGRRFTVEVPREPLPLFIEVAGLEPPPVGDVVVVVRRPPGLTDLFRRTSAPSRLERHARRLD